MAISKRVIDGKVSYEVFVKIRDNTGKQKAYRKRGFTSEREAKRAEFELRNRLEGYKAKMPWSKWSEHFLDRYRVEYRNSTFVGYKGFLEKWINPLWSDRFLDEITPSDVHAMVFDSIKDVSSHHRRNILKVIKKAFDVAVQDGILNRNPASGIKVKIAEVSQQVLNRKEIDILLKEAKSVQHRFYPHWCLAILTGMRSGELQALRWSDVDFVNGIISINKSWTRFNGEGPTKSAKNRICPMSAESRRFLQELKMQTGSTDHVLPRLWEWEHGCQAQVLRDFCRGIGITPVKFHDLRATFITQMLNNGVALAKVMTIVGHSSISTTQCYLRLSGKDVEGATEALGVEVPTLDSKGAKIVAFPKR